MRIAITGGSGFIRTNLVDYYLSKRAKVLNIDILSSRNSVHKSIWKKVDILNLKELRKTLKIFQPDYVFYFHMVARTDLNGSSIEEYSVNVLGAQNLIDALKPIENSKMTVFAPPMLVFRIGYKPADEFDYCSSTAYGESKIEGENRANQGC